MVTKREIILSLWKAQFGTPNRGDFGVWCTSAMRSTENERKLCDGLRIDLASMNFGNLNGS